MCILTFFAWTAKATTPEGPQLFEDEPDEDQEIHDRGNLIGFQQIFVLPLKSNSFACFVSKDDTFFNENHT